MKFLVIGGDAAGMSAASRAKRRNPDVEVTVLEKTRDVSYSACGMPYNIADRTRPIEDLVVRRAEVFREKQGIHLLTGHRVESIDIEGKTVNGISDQEKPFSFPYDRLLIATGATPVIPDIPGKDLPGVMVLKNLDHGRRIKSFIESRSVQKVAIVGMGYIALEMCEAFRARSIDVEMIKPGPVFLPWMDSELSDIIRREIESQGIQLHLGHGVIGLEQNGHRLRLVSGGLSIDTDLVLFTMGITPNSELAEAAGLETGFMNAVSVDRYARTSDDAVFAAGDCADAYHAVTGKKTWIPLALRANRAGWAVADNLMGNRTSLEAICGTAVFKVFDLQVARTGLNEREAEESGFSPAVVTITTRSRAHGHPGASPIRVHMVGDRKTGRLLGVQMVGKEGAAHRINAAAVALHTRMTVQEFSQTDLAYAPPFGPVWDPLLTASHQLLKIL